MKNNNYDLDKDFEKSVIVGYVLRKNVVRLYTEFFIDKKTKMQQSSSKCLLIIKKGDSLFLKNNKFLAPIEFGDNIDKLIKNASVGEIFVKNIENIFCINRLDYLRFKMEAKLPIEYRD